MYNINYQYRNSYNNSNYYALPVSYKYTYDYVQEGNNNIIYPLLNSNINYKNQTPTKNIVPLFTQYQNDNVFYNYVPRTPSPSLFDLFIPFSFSFILFSLSLLLLTS